MIFSGGEFYFFTPFLLEMKKLKHLRQRLGDSRPLSKFSSLQCGQRTISEDSEGNSRRSNSHIKFWAGGLL